MKNTSIKDGMNIYKEKWRNIAYLDRARRFQTLWNLMLEQQRMRGTTSMLLHPNEVESEGLAIIVFIIRGVVVDVGDVSHGNTLVAHTEPMAMLDDLQSVMTPQILLIGLPLRLFIYTHEGVVELWCFEVKVIPFNSIRSNLLPFSSSVFVTASFASGGTELVGLAATEAADPRKSIPKGYQAGYREKWKCSVLANDSYAAKMLSRLTNATRNRRFIIVKVKVLMDDNGS